MVCSLGSRHSLDSHHDNHVMQAAHRKNDIEPLIAFADMMAMMRTLDEVLKVYDVCHGFWHSCFLQTAPCQGRRAEKLPK